MNLNEYQQEAAKTVKESIKRDESYFCLGLCGESGEVAEIIKKCRRDGTIDVENLQKELGDVLWYVSQLSLAFGLDLEGIAKQNLAKLKDRKARDVVGGSGDNR